MSKTTIYLIRHGESQGNQHNLFLGHTDMDITELGHAQAEKAAEFFADIHLDAIYSSDLQRAFHTAEHTAKKKGMEIIKDSGVREVFAGDWEGKSFTELPVLYPEEYAMWKNDVGNAHCVGGESVAQLKERIVAAVERIAAANEGKTIAIFTHATPIRIIKTAWDGLTLDDMKNVPWASNASVTHAEFEDGKFRVVEYSIDHFQGELVTKLPKSV